jgi:hypothetical protein
MQYMIYMHMRSAVAVAVGTAVGVVRRRLNPLYPRLSLSLSHTHTHTHTRLRPHRMSLLAVSSATHTHTHAHAHSRSPLFLSLSSLSLSLSLSLWLTKPVPSWRHTTRRRWGGVQRLDPSNHSSRTTLCASKAVRERRGERRKESPDNNCTVLSCVPDAVEMCCVCWANKWQPPLLLTSAVHQEAATSTSRGCY